MSSSITFSNDFTTQQVTIYLGIPILITGLIGGIINSIVFLSLKTFRQSSCAYYLTIMSIVNMGHLSTGLLSRIMITGFNMDWTQSSIIYCKFRPFCVQSCILISLTCMCLATIDQFLATCSSQRYQQWSNIKLAHRLTILSIIVWLLHGIPYCIFYNQIESITAGKYICVSTNENFYIYNLITATIIFDGLLPILINSFFALLAYKNIQNLAYRTLPLVRRGLDKQLTKIVLIQTISNILFTIPYVIVSILTLHSILMKESNSLEKFNSANILTLCIFYLNFATPFYMYMCISGRFRQQFIYVFYRMYPKRTQQRLTRLNLVAPQ